MARTHLLALVLALVACGGASAPRPVPPAPKPASGTMPTAAGSRTRPNVIARSAVRAVVAQGLGAFLRRVEVDDQPVFVGGKFHGFRIALLRDAEFWNGVDLRPGDVVTRINGLPIERPEQAQIAFESLPSARELRVSYDRDGKPREIVYPIVDEQ